VVIFIVIALSSGKVDALPLTSLKQGQLELTLTAINQKEKTIN